MDVAAPQRTATGWRRRLLIPGAAVLAVLLLGLVTWPDTPPLPVQADITERVDGIGEIKSRAQQPIIAPADAVVTTVLPAGAAVDADTLLVELRSDALQSQIEQERQLQRAEAAAARVALAEIDGRLLQLRSDAAAVRHRLHSQKRRVDLIEPLVAAGALSRFEFENERLAAEDLAGQLAALSEQIDLTDTRLTMLRQADAEQHAATAHRLEGLQRQLESLSIRAPFRGRWTDVGIEVGARVASGAVLGRLIDDTQVAFVIQVPERHLNALSEGQALELAIAGQRSAGHITRIDRTLTGGLFRADVTLDSTTTFLDGQTGSYRLTLPLTEPRYWVSAELGVEAHTQAEVWVERDGARERRTIQFGARQGDRLTVQAGAATGDRLSLAD